MTGFQTSLRQAIEAFIQQRGMSRTRFGEAALGDPSFVTVFGRGRSPRLDTADRLLTFIGLEPIGPGFRREVDAFLAVTGAKSSELGREVSGNPSFVTWLRRGGSPRLATVDKARAWMVDAASAEEVQTIRAMASGDEEISQDIFKGDYDMGDDRSSPFRLRGRALRASVRLVRYPPRAAWSAAGAAVGLLGAPAHGHVILDSRQ